MKTPSDVETKSAFNEYVADAEKRLKHDQEHPNDEKQVRPGEDIRVVNGKTVVSGSVAVIAINETLLQRLMSKNPDLSFALQESFPFAGLYADAAPLGPLMELHVPDGASALTPERAAQSIEYRRDAAQKVLSDSDAAESPATRKSYSHDAVAAANLLAAHNFGAEAEAGCRLVSTLWPENPESAGRLADLLSRSGRESEAGQLLGKYALKYPNMPKDLEQMSLTFRRVGSTSPAPPPKIRSSLKGTTSQPFVADATKGC
ncbi:MAG: hypothetical protein EXS36_14775 [Pedosphaera sp.]|nr:hypothetical protein [Pedosphaera sp.]